TSAVQPEWTRKPRAACFMGIPPDQFRIRVKITRKTRIQQSIRVRACESELFPELTSLLQFRVQALCRVRHRKDDGCRRWIGRQRLCLSAYRNLILLWRPSIDLSTNLLPPRWIGTLMRAYMQV